VLFREVQWAYGSCRSAAPHGRLTNLATFEMHVLAHIKMLDDSFGPSWCAHAVLRCGSCRMPTAPRGTARQNSNNN